MRYRIALQRSEEGYSVSVPGLPGCWSQGATEEEALSNIEQAIREYLTIPRNDPVNAYTMAGIVRDAGLSIEQFRRLL